MEAIRWTLAVVLLLAGGLAGCLGDVGVGTEANQQTTVCDEGEIDEGENGRVGPAQSMSFQATVTGEPASGEISIDAQGAGGFTVDLERDGQEVWSKSFTGAGNQGGNYYPDPLSAGNYTLTASSQTGTYDIVLSWSLTWSEGC